MRDLPACPGCERAGHAGVFVDRLVMMAFAANLVLNRAPMAARR